MFSTYPLKEMVKEGKLLVLTRITRIKKAYKRN